MSILQRADTNYAVIDMSVIWGVGNSFSSAIEDAKRWLDVETVDVKTNYYYPDTESLYILECSDALFECFGVGGVGGVCDPGNFEVLEKPGRNGHIVVLPREVA